MNVFQPLINDLREKRLWPVVIVLVGALVAVPVLLAKSAPKPRPAIASIGAATATSPISGLPVVTLSSTPQFSYLPGPGRDPFTQQMITTTTSATASATYSPSSGSGGTTGSNGSSSSTASGAGSGGTIPTGSSTTPPTPTTPTTTTTQTTTTTSTTTAKPAGLSSTESYEVALAMTNPDGGLNTIDPVVRLSPLPSAKQPLLLELGVLKGGSEVLFVVQPGTVLRGPAKCLPGKVECQIISLAPNQIESLYVNAATGPSHVSDFAVTGIKTITHKTAADATRARRQVSKVGATMLRELHYERVVAVPVRAESAARSSINAT